jgi:hypothetical protein
VLAAFLCGACAAPRSAEQRSQEAGISIDAIVIRNELAFPVTDVLIEVPATGAFAGCGNILPRSECSTSFEAVVYRANPMRISWKEYGQPHQTDEFVLQAPASMEAARAARVEVRIFAMGQAGAVLKQ